MSTKICHSNFANFAKMSRQRFGPIRTRPHCRPRPRCFRPEILSEFCEPKPARSSLSVHCRMCLILFFFSGREGAAVRRCFEGIRKDFSKTRRKPAGELAAFVIESRARFPLASSSAFTTSDFFGPLTSGSCKTSLWRRCSLAGGTTGSVEGPFSDASTRSSGSRLCRNWKIKMEISIASLVSLENSFESLKNAAKRIL